MTTKHDHDDAASTQRLPIRVFLLDDHEVVRRGVADLVETEPDMTVVWEASSSAETLSEVKRCLRASTPPETFTQRPTRDVRP